MEVALIQNKIFNIRGQRVMLDFDLAEMYGMETKVLKQSVRRNLDRFPPDFIFELTNEEYTSLRSQFVTLKKGRGRHSKYPPFAFSEHGVAMLSSILNSKLAIAVNINIIRAFIAMRQLVFESPTDKVDRLQTEVRELKAYIEEVFTDYNDINEDTRMQLELINETLAELQTDRKLLSSSNRKPIGYVKP